MEAFGSSGTREQNQREKEESDRQVNLPVMRANLRPAGCKS